MQTPQLSIRGVTGLPEISAGDDLASLIVGAMRAAQMDICDDDIFVIAQKVVSKAEGRTVQLDGIVPSAKAQQWADVYGKDARAVEVVLRESRRIVRMERGVLIAETAHGWICANAGVDASNTAAGTVVLLPEDPDASAQRLQVAFEKEFKAQLAVIVSDTFGRPWREGLVNVAIGVSGLQPLLDYRGQYDQHHRPLSVTVIAVADELASAAELVMKKSAGIPVAVIRGFEFAEREGTARQLIRARELDMFR